MLEQTEGTVVSAMIGRGQSQYYSGDSSQMYSRNSHYPDIAYQYQVNGQDYTHNRYSQRPTLINNTSIIQRIVNNYPVGATVTVYYDSENPQKSFLQKGYGGAVNLIIMGVVLVTVIALVAVVILIGATG